MEIKYAFRKGVVTSIPKESDIAITLVIFPVPDILHLAD